MKYVLVLLLVAGSAFGQTRAQLKESNRYLRQALLQAASDRDLYAEQVVKDMDAMNEMGKEIEQLKANQKLYIDWIVKLSNQPAPTPVYLPAVRQPVICTGSETPLDGGYKMTDQVCF